MFGLLNCPVTLGSVDLVPPAGLHRHLHSRAKHTGSQSITQNTHTEMKLKIKLNAKEKTPKIMQKLIIHIFSRLGLGLSDSGRSLPFPFINENDSLGRKISHYI